MMMQMIGAFAEYEREMIRERTRTGLEAARRAGRIGGRRRALTADQEKEVVRMVMGEGGSQAEAAKIFSVHPATVSCVITRARQSKSRPSDC